MTQPTTPKAAPGTHARRSFLRAAAATTVVGVALGCSADEDDDDTAADSEGGDADCSGGADGTIAGNHGHTASVSSADITAAAGKTYSIMGSSPHDHEITLGADDMAALASGMSVMVNSTSGGGDGHTHQVTLSC